MHAQHAIVWFNNRGGDLWAWPDGEGDLGLLTVIDGETLKEQASETRTSTTTSRVEDHESLKTSAIISELTDTIQDKIDNLLTNGVVSSRKIICCVFLT